MQLLRSMFIMQKIKQAAYKRINNYRVETIRKLPRKNQGTFSFNGCSMTYLDSFSFYHQYKDIFQDKMYHLVNEMVFEYHDFYNVPQGLGKILSILKCNGFAYLVADATNMMISIKIFFSTGLFKGAFWVKKLGLNLL